MSYSMEDVELLEKYFNLKAKDDFYTFRRLMHPKDKTGWFYKDLTAHLQQFYLDLAAGLRPNLIIQSPPQHGKSEAIVDFTAWICGKNPNLKVIFASFSDTLSVRANLKMQRMLSSIRYQKIFGSILNTKNITTVSSQKRRNSNLIEFTNGEGYFRNTTVNGSITGESLDLGVIDDPVKGREAANSPTVRDKTWDWYTNDFRTRFSEKAGFLMILTRWHIDDLAGRIKERGRAKVLNYKAIAEKNEEYRSEGEALFPEHKSLEFLLNMKRTMSIHYFESLYQQNPVVQGGNLFKLEWFRPVSREVIKTLTFQKYFIIADTAIGTKQQNDYTVYTAFGISDNRLYILDMYRGKVESLERELNARSFYKRNSKYPFDGMYVELKASGTDLYQRLKRDSLMVRGIERDKDKVTRAQEVLPYVELNGIYYIDDLDTNEYMLDEIVSFPNGVHDDMVDTIIDGVTIAYNPPKSSFVFELV
ncbi:MAG: phage terminase large subunit [Campylobacteraceae bacterium]|nr:phage terminase large subunit [Campylobacteraceae bacterium]